MFVVLRESLALTAGWALMFSQFLYCNHKYRIPVWKLAGLAAYYMAVAFLSGRIMYLIENLAWGGLSFFGGVLFVPAFLLFFSWVTRTNYLQVMDICTPGMCLISAVMKCKCLISGCCQGMIILYKQDGNPYRFPSREVELLFALILMSYFLIAIRRGRYSGKLYPLFMIIYGAGRFVLNFFRVTDLFIWILPAGHFWALISIALGFTFLGLVNKKQKGIFSIRLRDKKPEESAGF